MATLFAIAAGRRLLVGRVSARFTSEVGPSSGGAHCSPAAESEAVFGAPGN